ncbi:MAG: DUF6567 family protein [Anditalea sp.]
MKKTVYSLIATALLISLNSCGVNQAIVLNHNSNSTQVHLASKNYTVVEQVSGSAEVSYILAFGGVNKKQLYQNAYSELINKANLSGSKALVNLVTEQHLGGVPPFYYKRTITVSAHVVEFVD